MDAGKLSMFKHLLKVCSQLLFRLTFSIFERIDDHKIKQLVIYYHTAIVNIHYLYREAVIDYCVSI